MLMSRAQADDGRARTPDSAPMANRKVEMRWENVMSSGYITQVVLLRCCRIELHEWCNADPGVGGCIEGGEDSGGFQ